ncbi:MAG TPA: ABC transporter permease [Terracidiphilus sp.]
MKALASLFRRFSVLFSRNRFRSELDEEMAFHRAQAEGELMAAGMPAKEARYAAIRQFGNAARVRELSQEQVNFRAETVVQDARFALRQLRKNPGFGVLAIGILALGMGVSVAIFGFVDAALIQPLPYAQPNGLVFVTESAKMIPRANISRPDFEDWQRMNNTLSSLDVYTGTGFLLHMGQITEPVAARRVSAGFFATLGVKMLLGRDFLPGEDQAGRGKIAILPWSVWQKRFSGRQDVVGQSVNLDGNAYTIVGVLPREFVFAPARDSQFWVPLLDRTRCEQRRSCHNLDGVGRLRAGVTWETARADMQRIASQLERQYPDSNRDQGAFVAPLKEVLIGDVRPVLLMLLGGAGLLLLIAGVNVASLLLVRSESRRREIAVRGALGATRVRLVRQFVTEGLLLACAGWAAGMGVAAWFMQALRHLVPGSVVMRLPFLDAVGLNAHTVLFAAAVAIFSAVLLAVTPALRLGRGDNLHGSLSEGGRSSANRFWSRLGGNLVVVEITIAVVLLAGAGLLGKSFYKLLHVENGFDTSHLATANVMAREDLYKSPQQRVALYQEMERRLSALPGVQSVGLTTDLPLQCNCDTDWIRIKGKPFHGEHNEVNEREVSWNYLPTLKARLIRGRMLSEQDRLDTPQVMLINEALASKYFPGEDAIGQMVGEGDLAADSLRTIVGVVADVREGSLDADIWPTEYRTLEQNPSSGFAVAVRTAQDEGAMLPAIVSTLRSIDPNLGVYGEITMTGQMESSQEALLHRFSTVLVGGFAALALVLGVVGLYGVIAYSVSQRTREIGVRMALGAQRSSVYSMVMKQAGGLTAIGLGLGIACSIAASLSMRKLLFGVAAWDVSTLVGVAAVLGLASMMASFIPARRAASVNPSDALRAE